MQTFRDLERHLGLVPAATAAALSEVTAGRGRETALQRQSSRTLKALSEAALIQSTAASNAIEGIVAPTDRIAELVRGQTAPENRSEEEIAGYRKALDTIHSSAEHIPIRPSIVQQGLEDVTGTDPGIGGDRESVLGRDGEAEPVRPRAGATDLQLRPLPGQWSVGEDRQLPQPVHLAIQRHSGDLVVGRGAARSGPFARPLRGGAFASQNWHRVGSEKGNLGR